jgi:lipid-A-disaccharide synthase-like uncharacterized protein
VNPTIESPYWLLFGFSGQFVFFLRFLVQWLYSEKKGRSVIPVAFWYLSIGGALMILVYAAHRRDPVFIAGQAFALMIYIRNLFLIYRHGPTLPSSESDEKKSAR